MENMKILIPLTVLLGLLNVFLLHRLTTASMKSIAANDELRLFRLSMNRAYSLLGWVVIGLGVVFGVVGVLKKGTNSVTLTVVIGVFLFLLLIGLGTILYSRKHFVAFDVQKIYIYQPFTKMRVLDWDDLEKIKLNYLTNTYVLIGKDHRKYYINQHLIGIGSFLEMAKVRSVSF